MQVENTVRKYTYGIPTIIRYILYSCIHAYGYIPVDWIGSSSPLDFTFKTASSVNRFYFFFVVLLVLGCCSCCFFIVCKLQFISDSVWSVFGCLGCLDGWIRLRTNVRLSLDSNWSQS